jgi:hypothetical protein
MASRKERCCTGTKAIAIVVSKLIFELHVTPWFVSGHGFYFLVLNKGTYYPHYYFLQIPAIVLFSNVSGAYKNG